MSQHPLDISNEAVPTNIVNFTVNFTAFKKAVNRQVLIPLPSKLSRKQFRNNQVKRTEDSLRKEIAALQQELEIVKQEKSELAILLKQQQQVNKIQRQEMQIEIDLPKLAHQVAEITQTDYFQKLQTEVQSLRNNKMF